MCKRIYSADDVIHLARELRHAIERGWFNAVLGELLLRDAVARVVVP